MMRKKIARLRPTSQKLVLAVPILLFGTGCSSNNTAGGVDTTDKLGDSQDGSTPLDTGSSPGDTLQFESDTVSVPSDTQSDVDTGCASCDGSYETNPPDPCANQFWVAGCAEGDPNSACGGVCAVANACSPPESQNKSHLEMTFACPRFMLHSDEMIAAARDDAARYGWGATGDPPFVYAVVGHDPDSGSGGLDEGLSSTCCRCYQLVFETPEPGSPQPPELPIPVPMIAQSFNTAAGGPKNFDVFMGAGGYGAFNGCYDDPDFGSTSAFGHFPYDSFPNQFPGSGGIKALNFDECKQGGACTAASVSSSACQEHIEQACNKAHSSSDKTTHNTRQSCIYSNRLEGLYHQNWQVRVKPVSCPEALTRVTGCRLQDDHLPPPDPAAKNAQGADDDFKAGYTTTTMQDCCKPTCAWKDWVEGQGLAPKGDWTSFYSCDLGGEPLTL